MLVCEYDTIIQGSNQCKKSVGGVRKSWGIDWQNVESVQGLAETGTITGLTLKEGKTLKVLEYDNDNTASYNQTTNRVGLDARVEQVATLKFTGANVEKSVIANKAKGVHNGLWFHLQNDGTIHSQGAEFGAKGDKIITSLVGAKVNPNINSNTGEGSSDVTWNIVSTSTDTVPVMMTMEDLDALVGEDTGDSDMGGSDIGDSDGPIYDLPSVMLLPLEGTILSILWDDGGDISATRSLIIDNGTNSITLDSSLSSIDLGDILYGIESVGSSSQVYIISAEINNSIGTDTDSGTCSVLTRTWSAGRFIYEVNSVTMPFPLISAATITGSSISGATVDTSLWKSIQIRFKSYRNPDGFTPGEFVTDYTTRIYDSVTGLNIALNLSSIYCGTEHVTGDNVKVQLVPISGGVEGLSFHEESISVTVDGSNLITSINGVAC